MPSEALAVPPDDGLWFHDHKPVRPPDPDRPQGHPEGAIDILEVGAWPGLLEGSHLLAKGQVLQDKFRPRSAERADELDHDGEEKHE